LRGGGGRVKYLTLQKGGNTPAWFYLTETNAEATWLLICFLETYMAVVFAITCSTLAVGLLVGIGVGSIALVTGICPASPTKSLEAPSAYDLIPVQLSMARIGPSSAPPARRRMITPAKPEDGLTTEEQRRLAEAMKRLTPQERKRLAKVMKRLTPEERKQLTGVLKRQLEGKKAAPHLMQHAR